MSFNQCWKEAVRQIRQSLKLGIDPSDDFDDSMYSEEPFTIVIPFELRKSIYYLHARGYGYDIDFDIMQTECNADLQELMFAEHLINVKYSDFCFDPDDARDSLLKAFDERGEPNETLKGKVSLEEYIQSQLAAGKDYEVIRKDLLGDLHKGIEAESKRVFGKSFLSPKQVDAVAPTKGTTNIPENNGIDANRVYRWQCNGKKVCIDCRERHGQEYSYKAWVTFGLPKTFGSFCGEDCHRSLVDMGESFAA